MSVRFAPLCGLFCLLLSVQGCASGKKWVNRPYRHSKGHEDLRIYDDRQNQPITSYRKNTARLRAAPEEERTEVYHHEEESSDGPRPQVRLEETKKPVHRPPPDGQLLGTFRNTYYDFPSEASFGVGRDPVFSNTNDNNSNTNDGNLVPLMDRSCRPIKNVARAFYESVCVQGSGTLVDGRTVSFGKRDCDCASACPRTSQKICFDALDAHEFPWGRGAMGKAITPLLSVAVDSDVIPLGTSIYIAEYDGVERHAGGGTHNGCFVAEDRGMKVQGKHVDIFTGNPSTTAHLNQLVPSNLGVHVYLGTSRCK